MKKLYKISKYYNIVKQNIYSKKLYMKIYIAFKFKNILFQENLKEHILLSYTSHITNE